MCFTQVKTANQWKYAKVDFVTVGRAFYLHNLLPMHQKSNWDCLLQLRLSQSIQHHKLVPPMYETIQTRDVPDSDFAGYRI